MTTPPKDAPVTGRRLSMTGSALAAYLYGRLPGTEWEVRIGAVEDDVRAEAATAARSYEIDVDNDDFRDEHERAMRDHILDDKHPPEHRCDDLCSDAIVTRLAARLRSEQGERTPRVLADHYPKIDAT
jgi:hypothetical protein